MTFLMFLLMLLVGMVMVPRVPAITISNTFSCSDLPFTDCTDAIIVISAVCDTTDLYPIITSLSTAQGAETLINSEVELDKLIDAVCITSQFCPTPSEPCCLQTIAKYLDPTKVPAEVYTIITDLANYNACVKSPILTNSYCFPLIIEDLNTTIHSYLESGNLTKALNASHLHSCSNLASSGGNGCYQAINAAAIMSQLSTTLQSSFQSFAASYNLTLSISDFLPLCPTTSPTKSPTVSPVVGGGNHTTHSPTHKNGGDRSQFGPITIIATATLACALLILS